MPPTNASVLTDNLVRRLRDANALGIERTFVRQMLSDSQRIINGLMRTTKATVTLTTQPNKMFYKISEVAADVLRIEHVREGERNLHKTSLRTLNSVSRRWFRQVGPTFKHFALPGRDMLVVYPSKAIESSVDVIYTKLTTEFTDDTIEAELPDDNLNAVMDLAQIILLTKMREYTKLDAISKQFSDRNKVMYVNAAK